MGTDSKDLVTTLDKLFSVLDAIEYGSGMIFSNESEKERYESLLMFAFRKSQAAQYHLRNVHRLMTEASVESEASERLLRAEFANQSESGRKSMTAKFTTRIGGREYAFELSACLQAIKSGLDFIAAASVRHLRGVRADSIRTLMGLVSKGVRGPILNEVAQSYEWLSAVRDYRHHLIHRLVIAPARGWQTSVTEAGLVKASYPVVVPVRPPSHVSDTRRARMMDEAVPEGLSIREMKGRVTHSDGRQHLIREEISVDPAPGFTRIEDFMKEHIHAFEGFFVGIVQSLTDLRGMTATMVREIPHTRD